MPNVWIYTLSSVVLVSLISFVGILAISIKTENMKKILLYLVSFSAGALLGDVFIHLLPEIVEDKGFGINISLYVLLGIIVFFILEKIIDWHHHHDLNSKTHLHPFAITNLFGDAFHNFIDGLIIAVSYLVSIPVGIATTLAVVLHEIPQEIGDFGVLLHGGFTKARALFFNFITALMAIVGAIIALVISSYTANITTVLIPFAAGGFIYVAGSDLIPELHKEVAVKKSVLQLAAFILGILLMMTLLLLE
ncbi:ZIP family metal transporter [Candidatus Woesearchaeota archaeon]|nr:ZIP family metal transporter [Candidatus Woesearchaeota archaeon]|tara:strand:+ start:22842 stop:23591 length:750 start_codon:yes stop_codon:yes gene_type:complete